MFKRVSAFLVSCVLLGGLLGMSHSAQARDKAVFTMSAGAYDMAFHREQEVEGRIEYRSAYALLQPEDGVFRGFHPMIGIMGNTALAAFAYGGFAAPFRFADDNWEVVPSAGIGAYHNGNGLFLGGVMEFHLGMGVNYAITRDSRLGVSVDHISNGGTHRKNPGVNSVLLSWSFEFRE